MEEAYRTSCSKRIKPNLRSKIPSKRRLPIVFGPLVSRSTYPVQREFSWVWLRAPAAKKKMDCINMGFKHVHFLQKLSFGFFNKATDMDFYEIGQTLKKLTSFQSLTLKCINCLQLTDKAFYYLSSGLKRSSSLKEFNLYLNHNEQITDESLRHLSQSLRRLKELEVLKLSFSSCSKITDFGLSLLKTNLKNLLSLRSFAVLFSYEEKITEKGFLDICDTLKRFTCLHTLSLCLNSLPQRMIITNTVLERLAEVLERNASLRDLDLNLETPKKTTSLGLCGLFKGLSKLVCLKNLKMSFCGVLGFFERFGDQELLCLSEALGRLVCLRVLNIGFQYTSTGFRDRGLSHISQGLAQLKSLEEITLQLGNMQEITDQGLYMLGKGLEELVLLRKIEMEFVRFEKATDFGGLNFSNCLKNLYNLEKFQLEIQECPNFTGTGLYIMCQVLKDIPSLQEIKYIYQSSEICLKNKDEFLQAVNQPASFFPKFSENLKNKLDNKMRKQGKRNILNGFWVMFIFLMIIGILSSMYICKVM